MGSGCDIVCIQETKREVLDPLFLKKIAPASFDCFVFQASVGASGDFLKVRLSSRIVLLPVLK